MLYPVTAPENILFRQQLKNLSLHYRTEIIAALSQCILKGFHLTSLDLLCSCPDTNEATIISELRRTGLQFPRPYLSIKTEFTIGMDKDIEECSRRDVGLRSLAYSLIICYSIFYFFFRKNSFSKSTFAKSKVVWPNQESTLLSCEKANINLFIKHPLFRFFLLLFKKKNTHVLNILFRSNGVTQRKCCLTHDLKT